MLLPVASKIRRPRSPSSDESSTARTLMPRSWTFPVKAHVQPGHARVIEAGRVSIDSDVIVLGASRAAKEFASELTEGGHRPG